MSNVLIVKTGAAGDVLRTTFVLSDLNEHHSVYWLTDSNCVSLINASLAKVVTSTEEISNIHFDVIYSLEEDYELLLKIHKLRYNSIIGCIIVNNTVTYTAPNEQWFDISLISKFGIDYANKLKYDNTATFQEMLSNVFSIPWFGQCYNQLVYNYNDSIVSGDIAVAPTAGNKWTNKNWAYYTELIDILRARGYIVNILPNRGSIKEHIADIASHKLVICGDSLPMHIATALNIPSIALFTCTSPVEIYDYNLIKKVISKNLKQYFYCKGINRECTAGISINEVLEKINLI